MEISVLNGFLRRTRAACFAGATVSLILSGAIYANWTAENGVLRQQALEATRGAATTSEAIVRLNHWTYGHEGFAKNHSYFWVKALGPTPVQILHSGGDCADKSRLLSAMLSQLGIPSGLVMVYPCAACSPIHTVVEADYERGRMVVDPIWNVDYPAGGGRFYGIHDIAGTALGRQRIAILKAQNTSSAKIAAMPDTEATFDYARGLNWDKNAVMRTAAAMLRRLHVNPAFLLRPRILEDPKLALWVAFLLLAAFLFVAGALIGLVAQRHRPSPLVAAR